MLLCQATIYFLTNIIGTVSWEAIESTIAAASAVKRPKSRNPAAEFLRSGINLCTEAIEKPCIKQFSGIEKVHRNSIKITVALCQPAAEKMPDGKMPKDSNQRGSWPHRKHSSINLPYDLHRLFGLRLTHVASKSAQAFHCQSNKPVCLICHK